LALESLYASHLSDDLHEDKKLAARIARIDSIVIFFFIGVI